MKKEVNKSGKAVVVGSQVKFENRVIEQNDEIIRLLRQILENTGNRTVNPVTSPPYITPAPGYYEPVIHKWELTCNSESKEK